MDEEAVEWEYNKEFKALDITSKDLESLEVLGDSFALGGSRGTIEQHDEVAFGVARMFGTHMF